MIYQGEMFENGSSIFQGDLDVFDSEYELRVHKHVECMFRGKKLIISPFNKRMFLGSAVEQGYKITMEGNSLGRYLNGPKGHPGDGEYDIYSVCKLSISGVYKRGGLTVTIEASTGAGRDVCFFTGEEYENRFVPVVVKVLFHVPKADLKEFLGFSDNNISGFLARIDAIA
ncbi:hypothetical protein ACFOJE_20520 [Azotobacter bryophylli]|uniref:Uncharacterized protein n=1 Tax=Azotobacter bryophylli TaxID=1986537 RepID=A0ABV7AZZ6_9GAMM